MIALGTSVYAFGLVSVNIKNHLAEGGITGITLILRALFHIDPSLSTLFLNIPLIILGLRFLGKRALLLTLFGTVSLSFFLWFWQHAVTLPGIDLHNDLFISAVLAGIFGGFGSGLVYRFGGTTGGSDIIGRILEVKSGIQMGRTLLVFDILVMTASLTYLDIEHMMYTLLASFVFSKIVNTTEEGAYAAKGLLIVSTKSEELGQLFMNELERGVTYLSGEGGYHHEDRQVLYVVLSPNEINEAKHLIKLTDPRAFVSIIDVHETIGEGFSYLKKRKKPFSF